MITRANHLQGVTTINNSSTETALVGFPAVANSRCRLVSLILSNAAAATAQVFSILDGSGGTVLFKVSVAGGQTVNVLFGAPLKATINTALFVKMSAMVASDFHVNAVGLREATG